ncbi:hypothetical protein HanIR_Chr15g0776831 [Helianthus annuus]|nr:hypothetical protein HanIR_Chr15g0776831 [Helianthus annuus]
MHDDKGWLMTGMGENPVVTFLYGYIGSTPSTATSLSGPGPVLYAAARPIHAILYPAHLVHAGMLSYFYFIYLRAI